MAAVLACGEGAVLSHRSAAVLWRLLGDAKGYPDVSVPTTGGRSKRDGIRVHRRLSLAPNEVTRRRNIPVTKPARTIADLKRAVPAAEHRRAVRQAEVFGYPTGLDATEPTRSELEDLFLQLCRRHQLPAPEVNVRVAGHEVDFLWCEQKLVVETDGFRYHRGHAAFEEDHQRDLDLRTGGFAIQRYTYHQVTSEPKRVATSIEGAISLNP